MFLRVAITVTLVGAVLATGGIAAERPSEAPNRIRPKDRICFALYTVHDKTLKLTAQFYPLHDFEPFEATLQVQENGEWKTVDTADIVYPGYTAAFRVEEWDDTSPYTYRVVHNNTAFYKGVVQKNPVERDEFVLAAMSCNSVNPAHGGDNSRSDIVANLKRVKPDLVFFAGDQVYDHSQHYRFWLWFGEDFGEILRNTPNVCLPDDHDVGQANLWGAAGKRCLKRDGMAGGYYMPVAYVQEVERAQTSHLPDPFDPAPVERGIGVYYTQLTWGGISFAILEDRKFKSGPEAFNKHPPRPDSITTPGYDPKEFDGDGATLLGERQLTFLEQWATDWEDAEMKCVLSQTIFAQACNYSGNHERELLADFDSNAWPQTGRNRALKAIRKGHACMVAGDQHLGSVLHHGVDEWGDAGYSFATPAIANYWLRWWDPKQPGKNRNPDRPAYTGDFLDGFGNKMTIHAVANPTADERQANGDELSTRAAGIGMVRFNKRQRTITFECWPRDVDITGPESDQYSGWPVTISQVDNYAQTSSPSLPTLLLPSSNQVVTVVDDSTGEVVSSLRVQSDSYQPRTPGVGSYSISVGEGSAKQWRRGLQSSAKNQSVIDVTAPAANITSEPK